MARVSIESFSSVAVVQIHVVDPLAGRWRPPAASIARRSSPVGSGRTRWNASHVVP
jgi:hypothetical protein